MLETDEYLLHRCSHSRPLPAIPCAATVSSRPLLLHLEAEAVGDHGDEFAIGGLALGGVDGVAEILLQGFKPLKILPFPRQWLRFFAEGWGHPSRVIYCCVHWNE